jgi:hypothetical protein
MALHSTLAGQARFDAFRRSAGRLWFGPAPASRKPPHHLDSVVWYGVDNGRVEGER